ECIEVMKGRWDGYIFRGAERRCRDFRKQLGLFGLHYLKNRSQLWVGSVFETMSDGFAVLFEYVVSPPLGCRNDGKISGSPAADVDRHDRWRVVGQTVGGEEQFGVCRSEEKAVVVEIEIMIRQPGDVMKLRFDRM